MKKIILKEKELLEVRIDLIEGEENGENYAINMYCPNYKVDGGKCIASRYEKNGCNCICNCDTSNCNIYDAE